MRVANAMRAPFDFQDIKLPIKTRVYFTPLFRYFEGSLWRKQLKCVAGVCTRAHIINSDGDLLILSDGANARNSESATLI